MNKKLTIKRLIQYLQDNFNLEDKLCFWDEGGAWIECVHIPKTLIGDWMLNYVSKKRNLELERSNEDHKHYILESYKDVCDNDVVIY